MGSTGHAEHWHPDWTITTATEARRYRLTDLDHENRAVVVADLTHRGRSVAEIADRLRCSTRVVKRIRAAPLTRALGMYLDARRDTDDANRAHRAATVFYRQDTARREAEHDRLRATIGALTEQLRAARQATHEMRTP